MCDREPPVNTDTWEYRAAEKRIMVSHVDWPPSGGQEPSPCTQTFHLISNTASHSPLNSRTQVSDAVNPWLFCASSFHFWSKGMFRLVLSLLAKHPLNFYPPPPTHTLSAHPHPLPPFSFHVGHSLNVNMPTLPRTKAVKAEERKSTDLLIFKLSSRWPPWRR